MSTENRNHNNIQIISIRRTDFFWNVIINYSIKTTTDYSTHVEKHFLLVL